MHLRRSSPVFAGHALPVAHRAATRTAPAPDAGELRIAASLAQHGTLVERGELVVTRTGVVFVPRQAASQHRLVWQRRPLTGTSRSPILTAVRTGNPGRLTCPPTLFIEDADGRTVEFAVLGHAWSPNWSTKNHAARNRAVGALADALT